MNHYLTPNFAFAPILPVHGSGSRVWDENNKEYIDLAGGIAVNALGHCHPDLVQALTEQAQKLWHISNLYTTEPAQTLARKLTENSFSDKVFYANSGAEANEAALKLARKHARDHFGEHKTEIIACVNAFHGRTLFTVSVGGQPKYSADFAPLPADITHIPFNDVDALQAAISDKTCAVIIEPIQGESGVLPATRAFLQTARELCTRFQAALILDEVQTGMGRTGKLFAHQHFDVQPDIVSCAKALGGGFPIGAMLTTDEFAPSLSLGSHGSTFGGNPLACAVASKAFDLIHNESTYANIANQSQNLQAALKHIATETGIFSEIRGMGLLIGAVLSPQYENKAGDLVKLALQYGVMILQAGGNVIRFAPSLLLNDGDLREGMARFQAACTEFVKQ
ncbi:acetylornithine/succinyldiaminopimelate transaminase [Alysiella filiformis]|uniref:Acetylornithine aminotransferase n=1 Tax=Alysiella filiformis DSM 16848 TaxID=1120981 RepID=A0A286E1T5_9NEIS|nr:acetylornithine/succinyldiaminopimelate transaminase [Alysiella filiformis]QMT30791.1 acetylornithine/succinyldiaminopimelate transaminase [Alysiella filiformis]UBQ56227.1 acetylornithine/succinyldiaminopimelate transaminase [Alysiella filiformis DSM 16848]SOD64849.1 acetylornithine/N-succinyldiaminopimelate aminotransferase [Alysiella filiformis DSM 16848]